MGKTRTFARCIRLLLANGWQAKTTIDEYTSYQKPGSIGIDISREEMVFLDDSGVFLALPTNYYTLVGVLIEYRQLGMSYHSTLRQCHG